MSEGPKYNPKQQKKTNQNKASFYSIYLTVDLLPCWRGGANKLSALPKDVGWTNLTGI